MSKTNTHISHLDSISWDYLNSTQEKGEFSHLLPFNAGAWRPKDPASERICALSWIKTLEFFIPSHLIHLYRTGGTRNSSMTDELWAVAGPVGVPDAEGTGIL